MEMIKNQFNAIDGHLIRGVLDIITAHIPRRDIRAQMLHHFGSAESCRPLAQIFPVGDFLVLRAVRESGGTALTVTDRDMVVAMRELGSHEGISAAPEGGAALHAVRTLVQDGRIKSTDTVVVFNTGGALKYLDVL